MEEKGWSYMRKGLEEAGRRNLPWGFSKWSSPAYTLVSDLWPPQNRKRISVCCFVSKFVAIWYSSHSKLIQCLYLTGPGQHLLQAWLVPGALMNWPWSCPSSFSSSVFLCDGLPQRQTFPDWGTIWGCKLPFHRFSNSGRAKSILSK